VRKSIVWWVFVGLAACGSGAAGTADSGAPADAMDDGSFADVSAADPGVPAVDAYAPADIASLDLPDAGGDIEAAVPSCVGCHTDKGRLLASLEAEPPAGSEAGCSGEGEG